LQTPVLEQAPKQTRLGILGYGEVGYGLALGLRKVRAAARPLPDDTVARLRALVEGLESLPDAGELARTLAPLP
jgi:hypothetical protein